MVVECASRLEKYQASPAGAISWQNVKWQTGLPPSVSIALTRKQLNRCAVINKTHIRSLLLMTAVNGFSACWFAYGRPILFYISWRLLRNYAALSIFLVAIRELLRFTDSLLLPVSAALYRSVQLQGTHKLNHHQDLISQQ